MTVGLSNGAHYEMFRADVPGRALIVTIRLSILKHCPAATRVDVSPKISPNPDTCRNTVTHTDTEKDQ